MSKIRLTGSTSGYSEIQAPAVAGDQTFTLPSTGGTLALQGQSITLGTAQTPTSTTVAQFTGLPSTVRQITVMFRSVSTNGTSRLGIQLGNSAGTYYTSSGHDGTVTRLGTSGSSAAIHDTSFLLIETNAATNLWSGVARLTAIGNNLWTFDSTMSTHSAGSSNCVAAGSVNLSLIGQVERLRILTVNGTDVFDGGTINIAYE